jgi:hypothetical protein
LINEKKDFEITIRRLTVVSFKVFKMLLTPTLPYF